MKLTILGSGGCVPIPKPLCQCPICAEARKKGRPYARAGSCAFLHDLALLIDTPPLVADAINHANLTRVDRVLYTHLDPDHVDGHGVLATLYVDGARAEPLAKTVTLLVPPAIDERLGRLACQYGPVFDYYLEYRILEKRIFAAPVTLGGITVTPIFVEGNPATAYLYLFASPEGKRLLYAPCDTKPFPLDSPYVYDVDVLVTQPGFFETGLRGGYVYPHEDAARVELYSFEETLAIAKTIRARRVVFVHLEEYWNRGFDDYRALEQVYEGITFAYDGMVINL